MPESRKPNSALELLRKLYNAVNWCEDDKKNGLEQPASDLFHVKGTVSLALLNEIEELINE